MTSSTGPLAAETIDRLRQVTTATVASRLFKRGFKKVLVMPGDVLVGDGDGVVCIPRHVADTVAADALEQDRLEAFVLDRIKHGAPLPGTYPPSEAIRAEYEASRRTHSPGR